MDIMEINTKYTFQKYFYDHHYSLYVHSWIVFLAKIKINGPKSIPGVP